MAIDYTNGSGNGLFDILGKYFFALETLNTARGTTVATEVLDAVRQYKLKTNADLNFDRAIEGLANSEQSWRSSGSILTSSIQRSAESFLTEVVRIDSKNNNLSLSEVMEYLIAQMESDSFYVASNSAAAPFPNAAPSNVNDIRITISAIDGQGRSLRNLFAETIEIEATAGGDTPVLEFRGERASRNSLAEDWPAGSGVSVSLSPVTSTDGVVTNGGFEDSSVADTPDNWFVGVGTPGSTVTLTDQTVQTIIISGTPTTGTYHIAVTNTITSKVHVTESLSFDASGSDLETALRNLPGLGSVTVSSTGTSPNLTHTVTFTGVARQVALMTSTAFFDTGSIAHAIVAAGEVGAFEGRSLVFKGHATELTAMYQEITIDPQVLYAFGIYFLAASFEIAFSLVDGIGGTVIKDDAGSDQKSVQVGSLASPSRLSSFFRVAKGTKMPIYLKIAKETADTDDYTMDDVILAPAAQLYSGGPFASAFNGVAPAVVGESWSSTNTNNYAGKFQKHFNAIYGMAEKELLLPTSGTTLIPDTLIS